MDKKEKGRLREQAASASIILDNASVDNYTPQCTPALKPNSKDKDLDLIEQYLGLKLALVKCRRGSKQPAEAGWNLAGAGCAQYV